MVNDKYLNISDIIYQIKFQYNTSSTREIAQKMGIEIIYEPPLKIKGFCRISEYRKKTKQIVIFYPEYENKAIAHEIFHHIENTCNFRLKRRKSEEFAEVFASAFASPAVL